MHGDSVFRKIQEFMRGGGKGKMLAGDMHVGRSLLCCSNSPKKNVAAPYAKVLLED